MVKGEIKMQINDEIIKKYYSDVSQTEFKRLHDFLKTHTIKQINFNGKSIPYYSCGEGEKTMLTFSGGHSGVEVLYESILGFENQYKMVVVNISPFNRLDDFSAGVNYILDEEGVGRVSVLGQSASGIFAQTYFKRNYDRVDAMVLTNTLAPNKKKNKKWGVFLIHLFPFSVLKAIFKKKVRSWTPPEGKLPPEAVERIRFKQAFMRHIIDMQFSKKNIMPLINIALEFNEKDEYPFEDFKDWKGKILIVTSEDDVCYKYVDTLMKHLPNTELFKFPVGYKHMAPMVFRDEFQNRIKDFFNKT